MKIGIIGAGNIGATVARLFINAGHEVAISNSRGPASLQPLVKELGAKAHAASKDGAARFGEIVLLVDVQEDGDQFRAETLRALSRHIPAGPQACCAQWHLARRPRRRSPLRHHRRSRDNCSFQCEESVSEKPGFGECRRTCATRGDRSRPDCAGARRNLCHFIPRGRSLYHIGIFGESGRRFGRGLLAPAAWAIDPVSGPLVLKLK